MIFNNFIELYVLMICASEGQTDVVLDFNDRDNDESRQWCQDTDNMEIIMIKTLADYNEVTTKLTAESVATSLQFWIGLKWDEVEQNFYWIDNTILTWNRWCYEGSYNSDEPDCMTSSSSLRPCSTYFEKNQNCVRLTHDQQSAWCFATRPCGADYNTMCRGVSDSAEATTSTTTIKESTEAEAITTVPTYPETTTTHLQTTPDIQTTTALTTMRGSTEAETTTYQPQTPLVTVYTTKSKTTITTPTIKESTEAEAVTTHLNVPDTTTNPPQTSVSDSAEAATSTTTIKESTEAEAITTVPTYPETTTTHLQTTPDIQTTTALTTMRGSTEAATTTSQPQTPLVTVYTTKSKTTITTPTIKESTEAEAVTTHLNVPDTTTNPPQTSGSSIQCLYGVTLHTNQNIAIQETTSTYIHPNGTALTCPVMKCHVISYVTIQSDPDTYLYKVQKDDISSYRRKLTCATDDRVSSSIFGYTAAVVVISLVFFVPLLVDLISFYEKYSKNKDQQYMDRER